MIGHHGNHLGNEAVALFVPVKIPLETLSSQSHILIELHPEVRFGEIPELHMGRGILKSLFHPVFEFDAFGDHLGKGSPSDELGLEGIRRWKQDKPGVTIRNTVHPQIVPGQQEIVIGGVVKGGDIIVDRTGGEFRQGSHQFFSVQSFDDIGGQGFHLLPGARETGHVIEDFPLAVKLGNHSHIGQIPGFFDDVVFDPADGVARQALQVKEFPSGGQPVFCGHPVHRTPFGMFQHPLPVQHFHIAGKDGGGIHITMDDIGFPGIFPEVFKAAVPSQADQQEYKDHDFLKQRGGAQGVKKSSHEDKHRGDQEGGDHEL